MIFKLAIKIVFLALELFLGIYSLIMTDSLMMKFLFFVVTAVIIAFLIMKFTNKLLPSDTDSLVSEDFSAEKFLKEEKVI